MTNAELTAVIVSLETVAQRMDTENRNVANAYRDCASQLRRYLPAQKAEATVPVVEPDPPPTTTTTTKKRKKKRGIATGVFGGGDED